MIVNPNWIQGEFIVNFEKFIKDITKKEVTYVGNKHYCLKKVYPGKRFDMETSQHSFKVKNRLGFILYSIYISQSRLGKVCTINHHNDDLMSFDEAKKLVSILKQLKESYYRNKRL